MNAINGSDEGGNSAAQAFAGDSADEAQSETVRLWVEASLGSLLTAEDIKVLQRMTPSKRARWMENFCDVSAVAAFKRLHLRMKSIALDHITMNMSVTEQHKTMILRLMDRISENLSMAEVDVNSSQRAEEMLAGIRVDDSRLAVNRQQAASASNIASASMSQRMQDFMIFGAGPSHAYGFVGGGQNS
jgi:hypothetical protein